MIAAFIPLFSAFAAEALYRGAWALARWLHRPVAKDSFELYGVGESTAAGMPYGKKANLAQLVYHEFGGHVGNRRIIAKSFARGGESIFPQAVAFERWLRLRKSSNPGVVLIYSGHNNLDIPSMTASWQERGVQFVLARSLLARDLVYLAHLKGHFLTVFRLHKNKMPFYMAYGIAWWKFWLMFLVENSRQAGLIPVLSTTVANLSDLAPPLRRGMGLDANRACGLIGRGRSLEESGRYIEAERFYQRQVDVYPRIRAFLEYRIGRCELRQGRYARAGRDFRLARDLEPPDFGHVATSRQNQYIRTLSEDKRFPLADAAEIFKEHASHGLLGDDLFSDGQHPNAEGYVLLANAYARAVRKVFQEGPIREFQGAEDLFRRIEFTRQDRIRSLLHSGGWLLRSAAGSYAPWGSLKAARRRFSEVISLDPENYQAWFALGFISAGLRSCAFMADQGNIDFLSHALESAEKAPASRGNPGELQMILERLHAARVPSAILAKMAETYPSNATAP